MKVVIVLLSLMCCVLVIEGSGTCSYQGRTGYCVKKCKRRKRCTGLNSQCPANTGCCFKKKKPPSHVCFPRPTPPYIPPILKCPTIRSSSHCPVHCTFDSDCRSGVERCCYGCCRSLLEQVSCRDRATGNIGTCLERMYCDAPRVQGSFCPFPNQKCVCCYTPQIPPQKPGKCPIMKRAPGHDCKSDADCSGNLKCCLGWCVPPLSCVDQSTGIPGTCLERDQCHRPKVPGSPCPNPYQKCTCCYTPRPPKPGKCPLLQPGFRDVGGKPCTQDFQCPREQKCCYGQCMDIETCIGPAGEGVCVHPPDCKFKQWPYCTHGKNCTCCIKPNDKPGKCPAWPPTFVGLQPCVLDSECVGDEKCCFGFFSGYCVPAVLKECFVNQINASGQCLLPHQCRPPFTKYPNICKDKHCICCAKKPTRPGKCPLLQPGFRDVGGKPCTQDSQCPGEQKCCYDQCMDIETCVGDKGEGVCLHPPDCKFDQFPYCPHRKGCICCIKKDKRGKCPIRPQKGQSCDDDFDCQGNLKCCFGFFRGYCVQPIYPRCFVENIGWGECMLPHQCHLTKHTNICTDKHCICCASGKSPLHPGKCPLLRQGPGHDCKDDAGCAKTKKCCLGWCVAPLTCVDTKTGITGICLEQNQCPPPRVQGSHCLRPHEKCICCYTPPPPKPGKCPLLQPGFRDVGGKPCKHDFQCQREQKCCYDQCMDIETCIGPEGEGVCLHRPHCQYKQWPYCTHQKNCTCCIKPNDKPGKCPTRPPTFAGLQPCVLDSECVGDEKCCFGFFSGFCVPVVLKECFVNEIHASGQCLLPHQCSPPFTKYPNICKDKHCICCAKKPHPGKLGKCPLGIKGQADECNNDDDCYKTLKCCQGWCKAPYSCVDTKTGIKGICLEQNQCPPPRVQGSHCLNPYQKCICCYTPPPPKPGKCPLLQPGLRDVGGKPCKHDFQCPRKQKCCYDQCMDIETCIGPEGEGVCLHRPHCQFKQWPYCTHEKNCTCCIKPNDKPGKCPAWPPTFAGLQPCVLDSECIRDEKCCFGFFSGFCVPAVLKECFVNEIHTSGQCLLPHQCRPPFTKYPNICKDKHCICCTKKQKPGKCPTITQGQGKNCIVDDQCTGNKKCCNGWCEHPVSCTDHKTKLPGLCEPSSQCLPPKQIGSVCPFHRDCICCYEKPGKCPTSSNPKSSGPCTYDTDCHGEQKCCNGRCVHIERCSGPAGAGVCTHPPDCPFVKFPYCKQKECVCCIRRVKPGKCPKLEPPTFDGLRRCNDDFDCENDWKCCFRFFMGYCVPPVKCNFPGTSIWGKCLMPEHCHSPMHKYQNICKDKNCTCCVKRADIPPPRPGKCPSHFNKEKKCTFDQQCPNPHKCCNGWCADPIRCFVPRVGAGLCMIPAQCHPPKVPFKGFCKDTHCICCVPPPPTTAPPTTPQPTTPPSTTPPPTSTCTVFWAGRFWTGQCMEPRDCKKKFKRCFKPNCLVPGGICCTNGKACCFTKKRRPNSNACI